MIRHSLNIFFPGQSSGELNRTKPAIRSVQKTVLSIDRSSSHVRRKLYHMAMGLFCFALYAFVLSRGQALAVLGVVGGILVGVDIFRFRYPALNVATLRVFGSVMRREELKSITANSFFILGLFIIVLFFSKPIVLLSAIYLAIGDPLAALVGTRYGRHYFPIKSLAKKSFEGSGANFAACSLATWCVATFIFNVPPAAAIPFALIGGAVSAVSELIPFPINDNFTIPVLSAALLSLLASAFPWL
jgi:dolichol kinase